MTEADNRTHRPGEAAARVQRRRFWTIMAVLAGAGFTVGFGTSLVEDDAAGELFGRLPAWFAILAASVTAAAMIGGSWIFYRRIDEVERHDNLVASTVAVHVYMIGYPVWFMLWRGALVPEPDHLALYLATFAAMLLTYLYKKLF